MRKFYLPIILVAGMASIPQVANAWVPEEVSISAPWQGAIYHRGASQWQQESIRCTKGNFDGYATFKYKVTKYNPDRNNSSYRKDPVYFVSYVQGLNYTIHKNNGQKGGNKANIDLIRDIAQRSYDRKKVEHKSPDNMKQDGKSYGLDLYSRDAGFVGDKIDVKFTFDKSGADPKCTTSLNPKSF